MCSGSNTLSACAEQMLMFPPASLIIAGIIVIELQSHSCACFGLDSLTTAHIWQRALGIEVTVDKKDRITRAAHEGSTKYLPLKHSWSRFVSLLSLNSIFFFVSPHALLPAETWTRCYLLHLCHSSLLSLYRCLKMAHSYLLDKNFEEKGMAVKSFTNICKAIMLNYGLSTFA